MHGGFRKDIQGLRALAVLLVVVDHFGIGPFHGGYVGVDVFFVISGYLITGLLLAESEETGRVSLLGFYARRARRILPAATVVIVATVAASIALLSAVQAKQVITDALWATFFLANVKFARDGTDYFHANVPPSPLQHYWSLAVEEQFYVVWPLVVLVLCGIAYLWRRYRSDVDGGSRVRELAVPTLAVIVAVSFAWSVIDGNRDSVGSYFSAFTRAWELGVGGLGAGLSTRLVRLPRAWQSALAWLGLGAVLLASLVYDGSTLFPGYAAALPVLGAAALLLGGLRPARWGPGLLLELPPVRAIGDWSYSIYLWHWPVLVLLTEAWHRPAGEARVGALMIVLALSALSFRYVEDPVRRAQVLRRRRLRAVLLYPTVVVLTLPVLAAGNAVVRSEVSGGGPPISTSAYGQRPGAPLAAFSSDPVVALVQASIKAAQNGVDIPANLEPALLDLESDIPSVGRCEYYYINQHRPLCRRGDPQGRRTLVLIGDSHARQWLPALEPLARRYGYRAYYFVREGCPASDVTPWLVHGGPSEDCANFQAWARRQVAALHPDVVLLASEANRRGFATDSGRHVSDVPTMAAMYRDGMVRELDDLAPYAGREVIIGDPPEVTEDPGLCLSARGATLRSCLLHEDKESLVFINALREAAASTGTQFVETGSWFCARGVCPSVVGRYVAHRDQTHIGVPYAAHLTDELEQQIQLDRDVGAG